MISILILLAKLLCSFFACAWVSAAAARAVGSRRGTMRVGMAAVFLICLIDVACMAVSSLLPAVPTPGMAGLLIALSMTALFASYFILKASFRLSVGRAFAPLCAVLALWALTIGVAVFVIKPFLVEAFVTPTAAMSPTIKQGDRFTANKISQLKRFDVVVYRQNDRGKKELWCKRLVGLPGERLKFKSGGLFINDRAVTPPPVLAGRCHAYVGPRGSAYGRYVDGQTITLGRDEFFAIGDNVDNSYDSRLEGPSKTSTIVGVVDFIYWPVREMRLVK